MNLASRALFATLVFRLLCQHVVLTQVVDPQNSAHAAETADQGEQNPGGDAEAVGSQFKFRGREWHPESFGYTNCSSPTPKINESGNIFGCRILRDVCLDQGVVIYQDSRYHPWTSENRLPFFNITDILWNTPSVLGIGDKWKIGKNRYQFPLMRPWHHMEESDDVRRPVFSNCTTPLLFFHHFPFNVAEVYRFAVNNIYFLQQRLRFFDDRITLVPGSPPMSAVPGFTRFWLQPFSRYAITSMGALSQRWPAGTAPPPSASTGEGTAVRCFSNFIMCKITLRKPTGAFFEAGQFVANYYAKKAQPFEANFTARLAAVVPAAELADDSVLKVVFAVRSKSHKDIGRLLLNEDDLIERCNRQEPPLQWRNGSGSASGRGRGWGAASIFRSVRCFRHIFGVDNLYDMWLVRQSDVLVGVHGSALTNAMFMRRGSALIELRPFGFSGRESWPNIYMKSQTRGNDVFWFGIDVMNGSLSSPGDFESDMQSIYTRAKGCLARDRNLIVPWEALAHQLLNVAVVSRSVWRYKVLRYSHAYYITHDLQPLEQRGKDRRAPEALQSWFTDPEEERRRAAAIPLTPEGASAAAAAETAVLMKAAEEKEEARAAAAKAEEEAASAAGEQGGGGAGGSEAADGGEGGGQQQEGHPHAMDQEQQQGAAGAGGGAGEPREGAAAGGKGARHGQQQQQRLSLRRRDRGGGGGRGRRNQQQQHPQHRRPRQ